MKVISRSEMELDIDGRLATVSGEAHLPGYGGPNFVVFSKMAMTWEDGQPVSDEERQEILRRIPLEAEKAGLVVEVG